MILWELFLRIFATFSPLRFQIFMLIAMLKLVAPAVHIAVQMEATVLVSMLERTTHSSVNDGK